MPADKTTVAPSLTDTTTWGGIFPRREPLRFSLSTSEPATHRADVLVVGAFDDGTLAPATRAVDEASGGKIAAVIDRRDLGDKPGSTLTLYDLPGVATPRVLLVSL